MAQVRLDGVRKVYDNGFVAVKGADFEVADGEFLVLVGPSGCGKSTLLRMIAGLESISEGTLAIGERVVNDVAPKDRDIAMVFQSYALYPHMSVAENLAFGLRLRGQSKEEIARRTAEAAEILGLDTMLERKPGQLSGGQRQRVALGRALVRDPAVFLLDEPLSNLDAKLRTSMRVEIARLHRRLGATMIYVTHDQIEAMTLGQRIVVLKDGEVQQIDTPMNLYDRPANLFVAGFLGSPAMNLFDGEVAADGTLRLQGRPVALDPAQSAALAGHRGRRVVVGIRPEQLHVGGSDTAGAIRVRLDVVEPVGNEVFLYASADGREVIARMPPGAELPTPGAELTLAFEPARLHFFDPDSERRMPAAPSAAAA
ncbi:ABC transporter ATP-binding protein [Coralloluteibacterium stylophorae]|uniref:sn-glycerol-3-phosphate ABC transporter ATP-binding protein UgpC n=1 Tax=Coralloluteibacterium stylophorae TaxID=1776034 RepID=A0A8J7VTZ2_9GAMM|nr:sn-glycerol-3-phosphate ABC transporter ATP-binding protein UgpC [Coralloluteibacterium stylophorae]MBS7456145.1 sn-glycerol-3-phosphate ABC transporter ATP-binding protein UgpC [Coralloluteibacterium stylophorae]